ncbi:hypothetical protein P152DRAFT_457161 [Eremomyces bilateralis CBS 781.70]|uniref:Uncharacterized protein n=1 Tax=Eremomyces bilateralis CBS 781.70 TaxID=1392243 RepID=A0A6G1G6X2_9PEZI|nr:uncharacterized protein P152DRAFT_457161 [Eremomyces bilateralis CBS 781.70]KAF1813793.1 hypothetical protein P152DRAFT_457161 [Eremomyces bilateralis CBS 781.70]
MSFRLARANTPRADIDDQGGPLVVAVWQEELESGAIPGDDSAADAALTIGRFF